MSDAWDAVNRYSAGKVGAIQEQIADLFPNVEMRDCAATVTALRLLGCVIERNLEADGPDRAREVLISFLRDFARNLSQDANGEHRGRTVTISVGWREGEEPVDIDPAAERVAEAVMGVNRIPCVRCEANGWIIKNGETAPCPACGGKGWGLA